ncbi:MAG: sodium-dependent transporter [Anaerovoracaceae bacterium]
MNYLERVIGEVMSENKGQWGSSFGFLMAAVGSAVGLGNLWGFPYKMGKSGGFAFLLMYLILAVLIGFVIMVGELTIGRKTGKGVVGAYAALSSKFRPLGWMGFIAPMLILSFYSMLGGYCLKYAVGNIGDIFNASWGINNADPGAYFSAFTSDPVASSIYTIIFMVLTIGIVMGGISGGIEKFSKIAMPALFIMLLVVIARSVTLPGASEGLAFMFKPNWEVFQGNGWMSILAIAGGQMFFSLSLGMGVMITFGSYLPKSENIEQKSVLIPIADTLVAIMAGLAVMPAVFAMGMEPAQGPGLLFITLQAVFSHMGTLGPIFGFLLYALVFIAAITSSILLLEVGVSVLIDSREKKQQTINRKGITMALGLVITVLAVFVSVDGLGAGPLPQPLGFCWLDFLDLLSEGIMMPLGALIMSLIIGWSLGDKWLEDELTLEGNKWRSKAFSMICFKFIAPVGMLLVLVGQIDNFFQLGIFS